MPVPVAARIRLADGPPGSRKFRPAGPVMATSSPGRTSQRSFEATPRRMAPVSGSRTTTLLTHRATVSPRPSSPARTEAMESRRSVLAWPRSSTPGVRTPRLRPWRKRSPRPVRSGTTWRMSSEPAGVSRVLDAPRAMAGAETR
ncbi:hypothetical protein ElP_75550 (plasmid) [Tautonia plasticadhaerens]|uniref:Uncharacterized protein n=1 Tax=Tautonia plasticadhaerens TaxID=2527974 RepID=A0A518HFG6_9BACT|nr:hypothetical protein ElP_75550 [Tautonia plasticadhaerens]